MSNFEKSAEEAGKKIRGAVDALDALQPVYKAPALKAAEVFLSAPYHVAVNQWRRTTTMSAARKIVGPHVGRYTPPHSFGHTMLLDGSARLFPRAALGAINAAASTYLPDNVAAYATAPAAVLASALGVPMTNWAQGRQASSGLKAVLFSEACFAAGFTALYAPTRAAAGYEQHRQYGDAIAAGVAGGVGASATSWIPHGWAQSKQLLGEHWPPLPIAKKLQIAAKSAPAARVLSCVPVCMATAAVIEASRGLSAK
jgi:hypothetical protein